MLSVRNITYSYGKNAPNVLNDIKFDLEKGKCLAVLGNNGTGKSTLLQCMSSILKTHGASVVLGSKDILKMSRSAMAQSIAYVSQKANVSGMTVFDTVLLGRKPYIKWSETEEDYEIVREVIEEMGLSGFEMRKISELSGGELQKVMIAKALAQETDILLLDEPTSNLDLYNKHEVLKTIVELGKKRNLYVLIVLHDLNLALRYCDNILLLKDSRVYAYGREEVVNEESVKEVYGIDVEILNHKGKKILIGT